MLHCLLHAVLFDIFTMWYCVLQNIGNSFMFASVQTNTATKSIVLNCSEIVVNDVQFKGKDQCAFVYSVYFMFFCLHFLL